MDAQRFVTVADLDPDASADELSVVAVLYAETTDGARVLVLDDRGWGAAMGWYGGPPPDEPVDIWSFTTEDEIAETARVVVGPDDPWDDTVTHDDMARVYWADVAQRLVAAGVATEPSALAALPHDVELSAALSDRISRAARSTAPALPPRDPLRP